MSVSPRRTGGTAVGASATEAAPSGGSRRPGSPPSGQRQAAAGRPAAWAAGFAAAGIVLFLCYLRLSQTVPVNSDGASNVLQAWDMLHGNLLLHGWRLSDVSFYTTELPQYMLVASVRGLSPDVVHVAAAMTYTLLVLLAGLLAKGRATGRAGLVRVLIAAGIMLAPQLGSATYTLLLSPDHVGTGVPLLLIWLVIDRVRPRWYVPVVVGVLLTWVQMADSVALIIGVVPLVIACAIRACQGVVRRDDGPPSPGRRTPRWYDLSLAAAALASAGAASLAIRLIRENGGFVVSPASTQLARAAVLPRHAALASQGVLELFGAGVQGSQPGLDVFFATVHLAGLALAAWALILAVRRLFRWEDLLVPAFAVAIVVNVAAYIVSTTPTDIRSTREIAAVLPFGAVLAGRLLASRMLKVRRPAGRALISAATAGALCYVAALGYGAAQRPVPAEGQNLAAWLASHHLSDGLGSYWLADSTTLDSGRRILVVAAGMQGGDLVWGRNWETKTSWRDPRLRYANFVVSVSAPAYEARGLTPRTAQSVFGRPARTDRFGRYTVMIWDKNLLSAAARHPAKLASPAARAH